MSEMRRFYTIGFLLLVIFDTLAQLSFKFAGEHALPLEFSSSWLVRVFGEPWIYGALAGYVGAFFAWMTLLKHAPIGPAFAASHLEIVTVMVCSYVLFDEKIAWPQIAGALCIFSGIVCLAFGKERDASSIESEYERSDFAGTLGSSNVEKV
ncbi:4-amino-4-deoxy-L-arabinose-phosphoundecaprenol flippase subunit ArnF [compost metagenome]